MLSWEADISNHEAEGLGWGATQAVNSKLWFLKQKYTTLLPLNYESGKLLDT